MYTITRKIAMVCLAVVFSVLVYGCSGGDSQQASTPITDSPDMVMTSVDMMTNVSPGLTITPGSLTIQSGDTADVGDVTYECPADGLACDVTATADGVKSVGGAATATNSAVGQAKADAAAKLAEEERLNEERLAELRAVMTDVNTDLVLVGLTITPDVYVIDPGKTADAGDATLRCPSGEVRCIVTVTAGGTVKSVGGPATAELSTQGIVTLHTVRDVKIELVPRYVTIPEGRDEIQPNKYLQRGDVNFKCPEDGVRCIVEVDDEGAVTSAGGLVTVEGYSDEAIMTREAIVLYSPNADRTGNIGALEEADAAAVANAPTTANIVVKRRPLGDIEIRLTARLTAEDELNKYTEAVDTGSGITGFTTKWMYQTLERDNGVAAMMDVDAKDATWKDEATVYTNIERAKAGTWKLTGDSDNNPVPETGEMAFVVDAGQVDENGVIDSSDGETFTGAYIRENGSRIPGTFTCDGECTPAMASPRIDGDHRVVLNVRLIGGWTFESTNNVVEGDVPDSDYMYFGYWLKQPAEHDSDEDSGGRGLRIRYFLLR